MLEEAPGIGITPKIRQEMGDVALKLAKEAKYASSGTVEFLFDGKRFYFLEMNTRLQVEHPVTESVVGIDIVQEQIRIAAGEHLKFDQRNIQPRGHAIECRITAEDPARDFQPTTGLIERLILPGGPGVRVDTHIYAGYNVPPYYDSLLAKIIVWGKDRKEAITRMSRALSETDIRGLATNLSFHRDLIKHPEFVKGNISTSFLEKVVGV
jgi:acetyl-CoA carboxylase biotin carboxylase subunit